MTTECGSDLVSMDFDFSCEDEVECILCEEYFSVSKDPQKFLNHLFRKHHFVIGAVEEIIDLRQ